MSGPRQNVVEVIRAGFWFPIGTVEAWQQAQGLNLGVMKGR